MSSAKIFSKHAKCSGTTSCQVSGIFGVHAGHGWVSKDVPADVVDTRAQLFKASLT